MRKILISIASIGLVFALAVAPAASAKPNKPKATIVETVIDISGPSGSTTTPGTSTSFAMPWSRPSSTAC